MDSDAEVLISAAKLGGLPYAIHFRAGVFGSGLLTLSRCVGACAEVCVEYRRVGAQS